MVAPFLPDEEKVAAIRAELVASGAGIYLDAATAGPLPREADRAMREWADWELRTGRAGDDAAEEFAARAGEARAAVAAVLRAPASQVMLATDVGAAIRRAAEGRSWRRGERIVVAETLEAPVLAAVRRLGAALGAEVASVAVRPDRSSRAFLRRLDGALEDAVLVVLPHVSPLDGSLLDVAEVAALARRTGSRVAVDGSLAAGAIAVDAPTLGADVYAVAGDRWLLGPSGTAGAYLAPDMVGALADADDAAQLNRAAVVGLGRSVGWLAMQVGLEWAFVRTRLLLESAVRALETIEGVTLLAPADRLGAILAFRVAGWPAARLREELGRRAFAILGLTESADAVRLSVGFWNTDEEIRTFAATVGELAATTPGRVGGHPPIVIVQSD